MKKAKTKWFDGEIHWFDNSSREGMIKNSSGDLFYFHKTALKKPDTFLESRLKVRFTLIVDTTFVQVCKIKMHLGSAA